MLGGSFEFVSYQEVDAGQREEFETLLRKVGVALFHDHCYFQWMVNV